jgi:predicted nucleic acid-binding Zn ribbon protein
MDAHRVFLGVYAFECRACGERFEVKTPAG